MALLPLQIMYVQQIAQVIMNEQCRKQSQHLNNSQKSLKYAALHFVRWHHYHTCNVRDLNYHLLH